MTKDPESFKWLDRLKRPGCVAHSAKRTGLARLCPTCLFHLPSWQGWGVYQETVAPLVAADLILWSSVVLLQMRHSAGCVPQEFDVIFARAPLDGACITSRKRIRKFNELNELTAIIFPQVHPFQQRGRGYLYCPTALTILMLSFLSLTKTEGSASIISYEANAPIEATFCNGATSSSYRTMLTNSFRIVDRTAKKRQKPKADE